MEIKTIIADLERYLEGKDAAMRAMNPLERARGNEQYTAYFRGERHGACEVIEKVTNYVSEIKNAL